MHIVQLERSKKKSKRHFDCQKYIKTIAKELSFCNKLTFLTPKSKQGDRVNL